MDSNMTKHITGPFWFIPAFILAFAVTANAATSFVIWPMPPRQPGLSDSEYPAFRDYNYFKGFQDHIDKARSAPVDLLFDVTSRPATGWASGLLQGYITRPGRLLPTKSISLLARRCIRPVNTIQGRKMVLPAPAQRDRLCHFAPPTITRHPHRCHADPHLEI